MTGRSLLHRGRDAADPLTPIARRPVRMASSSAVHAEQSAAISANQWACRVGIVRGQHNRRVLEKPDHKSLAAHGALDPIAILEAVVKPELRTTRFEDLAGRG